METLQPIEASKATGEAKVLLDAIQQRLPRVPNMLAILGHSPKVLGSYLDLTDAFNGQLSARPCFNQKKMRPFAPNPFRSGCPGGPFLPS